MTALRTIQPIDLQTPGVMTAAELGTWAQVGKNIVPRLMSPFAIRSVAEHVKNRRCSVHEMMRKSLGITLETADDIELLLEHPQRSSWVLAVTGLSVSANGHAGRCRHPVT